MLDQSAITDAIVKHALGWNSYLTHSGPNSKPRIRPGSRRYLITVSATMAAHLYQSQITRNFKQDFQLLARTTVEFSRRVFPEDDPEIGFEFITGLLYDLGWELSFDRSEDEPRFQRFVDQTIVNIKLGNDADLSRSLRSAFRRRPLNSLERP